MEEFIYDHEAAKRRGLKGGKARAPQSPEKVHRAFNYAQTLSDPKLSELESLSRQAMITLRRRC